MSYEGRATGRGTEDRLREAALGLAAEPFRPHPLLANGHAQTVARWAWPRRYRAHPDGVRPFEVEPGVRLLARCRWPMARGMGVEAGHAATMEEFIPNPGDRLPIAPADGEGRCR